MSVRLPVEAQPTAVKGNKKGFQKYINSKRKTRKNVGLLLNGAGDLVTKDMEKAEVFNAAFAIFFTDKAGLQESWGPRSNRTVWSKKYSPSVEEDQVREHLNTLDIPKSVGADGVPSQVLRELAAVVVRPLSITFERLWWSGVPVDWKKANVTAIFKQAKKEDLGNCRLSCLTSVPGKVMEQIHLETISKDTKDKKVTGSSQQGFMQGKSCLAAFYKEMTGLVDNGRRVGVA